MNTIYIIGVGLIGGSFAIDIRKQNPDAIVYGIDTNDGYLDESLALGVIDKKATLDDLTNADLVIIAIPVDATVQLLPIILTSADFIISGK